MKRLFGFRNAGIGLMVATLLASGVAVTPPARAQDDGTAEAIGGILGAIIGAAMIDNARKAWQQVDPDVRDCLVQRYNISPNILANKAIGPNDARVADYVNSCNNIVSNLREQQRQAEEQRRAEAAAEQARQEALAEQAAAAERQRQADIAAAQAQRRAEEAAAEARRQAKHKLLVDKYGTSVAEAIESHRIEIGMSKQAVLESRGDPDRIEKIPPHTELWRYGSLRIVFDGILVTHVEH